VYPQQVETYIREGEKRRLEESIVKLQITHAGDPKGLFNTLQAKLSEAGGRTEETIDRAGLKSLKGKLSRSTGSKVKIK